MRRSARAVADLRAVSARARRARRAMARHPRLPLILDEPWYLARHRDVFRSGSSAADHFLGPGIREGRDPSPCVDVSFYATQVPGLPPVGPVLLQHLLDVGLPGGIRTSPYLDIGWYRRRNPSVPVDPVAAFQSLSQDCVVRRHDPSPFVDLAWYVDAYPEIDRAGLDPFGYFVALGGPLRRFAHPVWDEDSYVEDNEYVRFALGLGKHLHGYEHFCAVGHAEVARGAESLVVRLNGRSIEYAEDRYLGQNPDVAELVGSGAHSSGVAHFFEIGHREVAQGRRRIAPPSRRATATVEPARPRGTADVLVVLVHFDVDGVVDPHVLLAIDTYRAAGIDVCIVVVDVDGSSLDLLRPRVTHIVHRTENDTVRDFGAWQLALSGLGSELLSGYRRIVLANDSVYFPVSDPTEFLEALTTQDDDVWAATDSLSGGRFHIQSYFVALSPHALEVLLPEIGRRLAVFDDPTKLLLIKRFEVGLTQYALDRGLTVGAFRSVGALSAGSQGGLRDALSPPDPRDLAPLNVTILNQSHHFWRTALKEGLPFLKVELLRDNPLGLDLSGWEEDLEHAPCSTAMIQHHLRRVSR